MEEDVFGLWKGDDRQSNFTAYILYSWWIFFTTTSCPSTTTTTWSAQHVTGARDPEVKFDGCFSEGCRKTNAVFGDERDSSHLGRGGTNHSSTTTATYTIQ